MILREVAVITFVIITSLTMLFSWALGTSIWNGSARDCHAANVDHLQRNGEGPVKPCQ